MHGGSCARRSAALALALWCLLALRPAPAGALIVPLSLDQLTVCAGAVVRAHVVGSASRFADGKATEGAGIVTDVELRVDEALKLPTVSSLRTLSLLGADGGVGPAWAASPLKGLIGGEPGTTVTITVPGGSVGGWELQVEDAAAFQRGADYLVFLNAAGGVVGWRQGNPVIVDEWVPAFGRSLADVEARVARVDRQVRRLRSRLTVPLALATAAQGGTLLIAAGSAGDPAARDDVLRGEGVLGAVAGLSAALRAGMVRLPQLPALGEAVADSLGQFVPLSEAAGQKALKLSAALPAPRAVAAGGAGSLRSVAKPPPYATNMTAWMVAGPFDLSGASWARLNFRTWRGLPPGLDRLVAAVSVDGEHFYGQTLSGSSDGWELYRLGLQNWPLLGDVRNRSRVWVAFTFESDAIGSGEGVYLDNVTLASSKGALLYDGFEGGTGKWQLRGSPTWGVTRFRSYRGAYAMSSAAGGPRIDAVAPASAAAGIRATVTVTGSGFGKRQGDGRVDFFYKDGEPTIRGPIVSWSDTKIVARVPIGYVNRYPGSAGSGPLTVTTADGVTTTLRDFAVTYGWGRIWWPAGEARFRVDAPPRFAKAVRAAAEVWNQAGSPFRFIYAGKAKGGSVARDFRNELIWALIEEPGVIAYACPYTFRGYVVEVDQVFNSQFQWGNGSGDTMDVETICVHELGHWLSLRDLYGSADKHKCMYGFGDTGLVKRTLSDGDADGIRWIYAHVPKDEDAPVPTATAARVPRGGRAVLRFRIDDPEPSCGWASASIAIRDAAGEIVHEVADLERRTNVWVTYAFDCGLPSGTYTWEVSAKDMALHKQTRAGSGTLTVD